MQADPDCYWENHVETEGEGKRERQREEQTLSPARHCKVLQVLKQSCCNLPASPGSLFLWLLVSSQKHKISGWWKKPGHQSYLPETEKDQSPRVGKEQCMGFLTKPSFENDSNDLRGRYTQGRGFFLLWFCFLFNNMPFPSPHHISIRLLCKTSSLPELVWRPRGANEHLGHSCTPNQVFAAFHWPEVGQQASPLIHHLPLLHR